VSLGVEVDPVEQHRELGRYRDRDELAGVRAPDPDEAAAPSTSARRGHTF